MANLGKIDYSEIDKYISSPVPKLGEVNLSPKMDNVQYSETSRPKLAAPIDYSKYEDKPFYNDAQAVAKSIGKGAMVNLPEMAGQAAQALSTEGSAVSNWGKGVVDSAKARAKDWQVDMAGRGTVAKSLIEGGEMIAPSLATLPAYLAGPVAGAAATIALYGGSSYQDVYERSKAAGLSDSDAHKAGLMEGAIEAGGELISNKLSLGLLGAGKKAGMQAVTSGTLDQSVLKPFGKSFAKEAVGEQLTEGFQNYGQSKVEGAYGLSKEKGLGESFSETFGPTLGMSVLLSPLGLAGHYVSSKSNQESNERVKAIQHVLDSPESGNKMDRRRVVEMLHSDALKAGVNPKEASAWKAQAIIDIANNQPIYRGEVEAEKDLPDTSDKANKDLLPTGERLANKDLFKTYSKFDNLYRIHDDPNSEDYQSGYHAITSSLSSIINPEEGKTIDPVKQDEARKVLKLVEDANAVKTRQFNRQLEADKAASEIDQEEASKEVIADSSIEQTNQEEQIDPVADWAKALNEQSDLPDLTVDDLDWGTDLNKEQIDPEELKRLMDEDSGFNEPIDTEPTSIPQEPMEQTDTTESDVTVPPTLSRSDEVIAKLNEVDTNTNIDTKVSEVPAEPADSSQTEAAQAEPVEQAVQPVVQEEAKAPRVDLEAFKQNLEEPVNQEASVKPISTPSEIKEEIQTEPAKSVKTPKAPKEKVVKEKKEVAILPQDSTISISRDKVATKGIYSIPPKFTGDNGVITGKIVGPKLSKTGKVLGYFITTDYKNFDGSVETSTYLVPPTSISSINKSPSERIQNVASVNEEIATDKVLTDLGLTEDPEVIANSQEEVLPLDPEDADKISKLVDSLEDLRDELDISEPSERKEIKAKIKELEDTLSSLGYTERQKVVKYTTSESEDTIGIKVDEEDFLITVSDGLIEPIQLDDDGEERFMFAGEFSSTANLKGLSDAKSRIESGENREDVRKDTGWFKGADGKWRYEIDDSQASFKIPFSEIEESSLFGDKVKYKLSDILSHPQLFEAYPILNDFSFTKQKGFMDFGGLQGFFTPAESLVNITPYAQDPLSTLLHEVQHAIQTIEVFAKGGNEKSALEAVSQERLKGIAEGLHNSFLSEAEKLRAEYEISKKVISDDRYKEYLTFSIEASGHWSDYKYFQKEDMPEIAAQSNKDWYAANRKADKLLRDISKSLGFISTIDLPYQLYKDSDIVPGSSVEATLKIKSANINTLLNKALEAMDKVAIIRSGSREGLLKLLKDTNNTFGFYESLAGEVESRNVQARQNLSLQERLNTPISQTQDVKDDVIIITFKNPDEFNSKKPDWITDTSTTLAKIQANQKENKKIFDKFINRLSKSVTDKVVFKLIPDFKNTDLSLEGLSDKAEMARGVYKVIDGVPHIFMNGASSPQDFADTFIHELVGHFGVRKLFEKMKIDPSSSISNYDKFLVTLINNNPFFREQIVNRFENWAHYADNFTSFNKKPGETQEELYDRLEKEYKGEGSIILSFDIKSTKEGTRKVRIPVEVAVKLADEHIAEMAKELFFKEKFIEKNVGLGLKESQLRTAKHAQLKSFMKGIFDKIKHYLRSIFGEYVNSLSNKDIETMVAASASNLFENIDSELLQLGRVPTKTESTLSFKGKLKDSNGYTTTISDELYDISKEDQGETLLDKDVTNNFILADIPHLKETIDLVISGFGNHNDTIRSNFWNKLQNKINDNPLLSSMKSLGNMPFQEAYTAINNIYKGQIAKVENTVKDMANVLEGLNASTNDAIFEYMTNPGRDVEVLNIKPEQKVVIKRAKDAINELGRVSSEIGLINPETYEKNKDAYLHVMYLKYLDQYKGSNKSPSLLSWMKEKKKLNSREKAALGEIKDVRFLIAETLGVISRDHVLINMFNTIAKASNRNSLYWTLTNEDTIKLPWDNRKTASIDRAYALVDDMSFIISESKDINKVTFDGQEKTIAQLTLDREEVIRRINDLENKALEKAHEHAVSSGFTEHDNVHDFLKNHYVRMPNKPRYGLLRNQFVRKEIYNDLDVLTASYDLSNKDNIEKFFARGGTLERINRLWKMSMVALNPGSWLRNIAGNFTLLDMSTSTSSTKLIGMLYDEVNLSLNKKKPSDFWKLAEEYGLFGTTFSAVELQDMYSKYGDELESARASYEARTGSPWDKSLPILDERLLAIGKIMTAGKAIGHRTSATTAKGYALVEGAFKTVSFKDYIQTWESQNQEKYPSGYKSLSEVEQRALFSAAAAHANESLFDYSQVPSMIKTLRRVPFGAPFLTFSYKAGPATIRAMIRHPVKFAKYATLPAMLTMMAMATNDWDDKDIAHFKARLPEYYRNNPGIAFLPFKDSLGRPQILPLDYLLPWSQWATASRKVYDNFVKDGGESPVGTSIKSVGTVFNEFGFLGGPTPTAIAAMLSGRDAFTGKSILTPGASADQQLMEAMLFTYNLAAPAWLSSHGWFSKMYQSLGKPDTNQFGEVRFTPAQAASDITGFRAISIMEKGGIESRRKEFEFRLKEISTYRSQVIRDRSENSISKASKLKDIAIREKMVRTQMREALSQ